jgi:pimeloyl-ACP methyl ester carboxylesterase
VVLIPGIPGRCEWLRPAIAALARTHRVFGFSLGDLPAGDASFDAWVTTIDRALDRAGVTATTMVGASFGGLVAIHYAARRPGRVSALVLASAPSPRWRIDPRTAFYVRWPRLVMPALALRSAARLAPEALHTLTGWRERLAFAAGYTRRALRYPPSATALRRWVEAWIAADVECACARVAAPTTVITGEATLDRVVPVAGTLEILDLIPHARHVELPGTGHAGAMTQPRRFAELVDEAGRAAAGSGARPDAAPDPGADRGGAPDPGAPYVPPSLRATVIKSLNNA